MQYQQYRSRRVFSRAVVPAFAVGVAAIFGIVAQAQTPAAGGAAFVQAVQLQGRRQGVGGHSAVQAGDRRGLSTDKPGAVPARAGVRTCRQPGPGADRTRNACGRWFCHRAVAVEHDLDALRALPRFKTVEARVNANAHPCAADARFHQFDFWIGEWDVQPTGATRAPIGSGSTSIVEPQLEGCVIQENWLPIGGIGAGKSFNIFNTTTRLWEQYYVDSRGTITHYTGSFHDDGNLYYEANQFGTSNKVRMTFFNQGPRQVRQLGQVSTDGGKTWAVTYDLTYVRKK
jgi:hypothetical protein